MCSAPVGRSPVSMRSEPGSSSSSCRAGAAGEGGAGRLGHAAESMNPGCRCARTGHRLGSGRGAHHRSASRDPRAVGERAAGLPHLGRRHHRDADPHPHHADPARGDRGVRRPRRRRGRTSPRPPSSVRAVRHPPARHRHLPSGVAGGVRDARRGHLRVRAARERRTPRAARGRPALPLPPARDDRAPPRRRAARPGLRRARRLRVPLHRDAFSLYVHDDGAGWQPTRSPYGLG